MRYVGFYFEHIPAITPFLHEESFRATVANTDRQTHAWLGLYNMVLTVGSIASGSDTAHIHYYNQARSYLDLDSLGSGNMETLQALCLLGGYYLHYRNSPNMVYAIFGAAQRLGIALGLHRESHARPDTQDPKIAQRYAIQIEIRRRTWWSLYCLNTWASMTLGRPTCRYGWYGWGLLTGNSTFALHALLSKGYFHTLCKNLLWRQKETLLTLMLVMAHVFGRYNLPPHVLENRRSRDKSTSVVVLPPLPKSAARILHSSNQKTLGIYSAYVTIFVDQHITEDDCTLPLTGIKCGGDKGAREISTSPSFLPPTKFTSAFAALSGHRNEWSTIHDLCTRIRSGVWLEQSVIPHLQVSPGKDGLAPLNAYLYEFYKHGNVHALQTENMIRSGDLWFLLNNFSLVLATIVTSLENFMKLSPGMDTDLLDSMGGADASEDELDGKVLKSMNLPLRGQPVPKAGVAMAKQPKQSKVADSWDDDVSENSDEEISTAPKHVNHTAESPDEGSKRQFRSSTHDKGSNDADAFLEDEGLLQVLRVFRMLVAEFDARFRAFWA